MSLCIGMGLLLAPGAATCNVHAATVAARKPKLAEVLP